MLIMMAKLIYAKITVQFSASFTNPKSRLAFHYESAVLYVMCIHSVPNGTGISGSGSGSFIFPLEMTFSAVVSCPVVLRECAFHEEEHFESQMSQRRAISVQSVLVRKYIR